MSETPWSVKEQTVIDKETGVVLRFGSYGDGSNSVYLQVHLPGPSAKGATIRFQRNGEVTAIIPHVIDTPPLPPVEHTAEPYRENPATRTIGHKPGPEGAIAAKVPGKPWDTTFDPPGVAAPPVPRDNGGIKFNWPHVEQK